MGVWDALHNLLLANFYCTAKGEEIRASENYFLKAASQQPGL